MRLSSILLRSIGVLLFMFAAVSSSSAQSTCSIRLDAGEQGNVTVKGGDVVTVCLPLNSGTGYSWQVQQGGDATTLQPTSTFERGGTMPGAKGTVLFTVTPQTPGDYTLTFMLMPPGSNSAAAGRASVGLKVQ